MSDTSRGTPRAAPALAMSAALLVAACGEALTLPPATLETTEQTVTLYALTGTLPGTPSAYSILSLTVARPDRTIDFDFAVDMVAAAQDSAGKLVPAFIPRGGLGFTKDGGLQVVATPFDSLVLAPPDGYSDSLPVQADSGAVLVATSRRQQCNFGITLPRYAKLRIESVDRVNRSMTLRIRVDPNCGYRGLGSGVPSN